MKKIIILCIVFFSVTILTWCATQQERVIIQESSNINDVFYKKAKCNELANDFIEIHNKHYWSNWSNDFTIDSVFYVQESETCLLTYRLFIDLENQQYYVVDLLTHRTIMDSQNVWTEQYKKYEEFRSYLFNREQEEFEKNIWELKKYIW